MREVIAPMAELLRKREISADDLITFKYMDALRDDAFNTYAEKDLDKASDMAIEADKAIARGEGTLLTGIPMALKDNICSDGYPTTCGSVMLADYRPFYDATAWARLKAQGAVLLGKTNMDEFAMGSTSETCCNGAPKNPRNPKYVAGGSSGGAAAAVCANLAAYALGSDTGGSVRQPAAFCGIVGLKPTYGAVSRYGLIAHASSLDQIGVLANSVKDTAIVFEAIAGKDEHDMTTADFDYSGISDRLEKDMKGLKIGIAREFLNGAEPEVVSAVMNTAKFYEDNGADIIEFSFPALENALSVYYIIACAEASSNLGRYDGVRYGYRSFLRGYEGTMIDTRTEGFGDEVKRRIMLGTYVLSSGYYDAYYKKACVLRRRLCAEFDRVFERCDILLAPTAPTGAFPLGEKLESPVDMYLSDIATVPASIAGLPALSIPAGLDKNGLPVGVQLIGRKFGEEDILSAAYFYEKNGDTPVEDYDGGVIL